MPPSGYSSTQVDFLAQFLSSCAGALEKEAMDGQWSYLEGLSKEIDQITAYMAIEQLEPSQVAVLQFTREFYQRVLTCKPTTAQQFWTSVKAAVEEVSRSVAAIHIDPLQLRTSRMLRQTENTHI